MRGFLVAGFVVFTAATAVACSSEARYEEIPASASSLPAFDSSFRLVDSVVLESRPEAPLVRISGIAVDSAGHFIVADASERSVRIHAANGELLRRLGRSGDGPGEYRDPRYVVPMSGGRLIVGEGTGRFHEYQADSLVQTGQLDSLTFISSLVAGPDGSLIASTADRTRARLIALDGSGKFRKQTTVFRGIPVTENASDPRWQSVFQVWAAQCQSRLVVAATLSDSVWSADAIGSTWRANRAEIPSYAAPRLPTASSPVNRSRPFDWIKQYDVIQGLLCDGERIGFTYVRGVRNYGDPQVFMLHDGRSWTGYRDATPVLLLRADTLFTLLRPKSDSILIGKHVRR